MTQEPDLLSEHIDELVRTRAALDGLMPTARAHRENEELAPAVGARRRSGEGTSAPRILEN
ncbi:hypothetical protein AB0C11_28885 [Streptomyces sp. NPDC039016]|uniref:hypothetical protein n=1 Tax=Streptomyces sp. NPDC039016 TaxID=3154330 RepID=UPI0033E31FC7